MTNRHRTSRALSTRTRLFQSLAGLVLMTAALGCADDDQLKMTWFGISNWGLEVGGLNIVIDGYVTRIPAEYFSGGGGQLGLTTKGFPIDKALVDKMHGVLASRHPVKYLFTGHSHFDHSFDTPYWAKVTGATIIGAQTTCYQAQALGVPKTQCIPVFGGEGFRLSDNVTVQVVLWNHSGTHEQNPEQHDAVELKEPPMPDAEGNLRGGVAEDFPNGGGNRGYLFKVETPDKVQSIFWTNSGSTQDLQLDTIVNGTNYGSPLQSLAKAMTAAGLTSVDVWIGGGGEGVARYVVPVLRPAADIPTHLGDFFQKFDAGYDNGPFKDSGLAKYLDAAGVRLLSPVQYLDRFDLKPWGVEPVANRSQKMVFGFKDIPDPREAGVDLGVGDGATDGIDGGTDGTSDGGSPEASDASDASDADASDVPQDLASSDAADARDAGAARDTGAGRDARDVAAGP
ncbi:MAG: hypothetical protein QOI66_4902 [Myxococcales bacterium]|nr:hypothetical protein [Myxococcales bacterium]